MIQINDGCLFERDAYTLAVEFTNGINGVCDAADTVPVLVDLFVQLMRASEGASFGGSFDVAPRWELKR